jgi:hypothetical protein
MKSFTVLLIGLIGLLSGPITAQKMVPHSFRYQTETSDRETSDRATLDRDQLRLLTQVTQPNTTFLRLYFRGTQLGEGSYLVLEGTDGTRQELRKPDLENWHNSSAYFNGQSVRVSLFAAASDHNVVNIDSLKVNGGPANPAKGTRRAAPPQPGARSSAVAAAGVSTVTYPYAKAVGRFTNGIESYGTGWIAPNGAIVTSAYILSRLEDLSYDVIEFNVPPSNGTTVQHPSPQDQYPLSTATNKMIAYTTIVPVKISKELESVLVNTYAILTPLPNSTGLRPGERQQEYFRIATNPSSYIVDAMGDIPVDLLHYGAFPGDSYTGQFRTLHLYQASLLKQSDYLSVDVGGRPGSKRDEFIVYNGAGISASDHSDDGAPITYQESNVAIGVHNRGLTDGPSYAIGFREDGFRNNLAQFFSSNAVYVDSEGLYDPASGAIDKPYLSIQNAASDAPNGAQVNIARDTYYGPVTFNRPMTLLAPVGKVVMGLPYSSARKAANSTVAGNVALAEATRTHSRLERSETAEKVRAYPNPFREQTEINYPPGEGGRVSVNVLNMAGTTVATFTPGTDATGPQRVQWNGTDQNGIPVPTGLYLVQVNYGNQTFTTKVLKQ